MFDIGFSEIMVIAVVALIVIGPERLPRVARTLGHLFGRMQRYVNDVKADIQREMDLDELKKLRDSVEDSARSIEQSVNQELGAARDELRALESLEQTAAKTDPAAQPSAQAPAPELAPELPPAVPRPGPGTHA
ncbi:MAG: twin-arginine translocase subunit TatB [Burkholderiales bacterium]|nr:twin-arginine translocase subunit TatB [Burkholderiales bacterium]